MQVQGQQPPAAAAVPALNFGNFNGLLPPYATANAMKMLMHGCFSLTHTS